MAIQLDINNESKIATITFDLEGSKVNILSTPVMVKLDEFLDKVSSSQAEVLVFKSAKEGQFIAGADINEIKVLETQEQVQNAVQKGQSIFNKIEDLKQKTLAAIDGPCVGGGCELALACDYRVASDRSSTKIGLPEVQLGIIPGFGGCYRLPKLIGLQNSLDVILAGKTLRAKKAKRVGLIDELIPVAIFDQVVDKWIEKIKNKSKPKKSFKPKAKSDKFLNSKLGQPIVFKTAKKQLLKKSKGHYPAPLNALEVVKNSYGKNRSSALATEMKGFVKSAVTPESKNLIHLYFMMEENKKGFATSEKTQFKKIGSLGVLGAGTMGGGIAALAATKNHFVRMKDISQESLSRGFEAAADFWNKRLKRRHMTQQDFDEKMGRLTGTLDYSGFSGLDLVVEAVVENLDLKKRVLNESFEAAGEDVILATNTSSLSVNAMAEGLKKPENFVGLHFFNPVPVMPLVEVIRGDKTSDETLESVFQFSKKIGKTPIVVKDGPGFLVNRLLLPLLGEALFFLEEGCCIESVDKAFVNSFGMPMGPFRLMDEIGIDVCVKVLKIFQESLGERVQVPELIKKFDLEKRLGKKTKLGFYTYDSRGKEKAVDLSIYKELGLKNPKPERETQEYIDRGVYLMVNEAARALEEEIVSKVSDVDLAMIMGTGFPPFRGGLLKYADSVGVDKIIEKLKNWNAESKGLRYKPSMSLISYSDKGGFYS